jgi:hypothetical protein
VRGVALSAVVLVTACCGGSNPPPPPVCADAKPYAEAVVDAWLPACTVGSGFADPTAVLGAPDAVRTGGRLQGFMSLGFGGYATLDFGGCISDGPGADIRVFQAVSNEPLSVYVANEPAGPWTLLDFQVRCGQRVSPTDTVKGYCDFDLADGGLSSTRYVKVEDGELFPCPGDTDTEGADLDAVQVLN